MRMELSINNLSIYIHLIALNLIQNFINDLLLNRLTTVDSILFTQQTLFQN